VDIIAIVVAHYLGWFEGVAMEKIREEVELPEGVEAKLSGKTVEISGRKGVLKRTFDFQGVDIRQEGRTIAIETTSGRRRQRSAVGTIKSHLLNMIKGVTEGFRYKLRVVYAHFPITVKVEDGRVLIHNFLGERSPRVAGDEVIVEGIDKEEVGQTAFNIEQATYIKRRDPRVFQDGIYIVEKG